MKYKILYITFIIIGIFLCIYSVNIIKENNEKQKNYVTTTAKVVGYEECQLDDSIGQRYIAEYKIDRNTYQIKANSCTNMPKGLNKKVSIKYNPDNPSDAVFAGDITPYIIPIVGIAFIVFGIIFLLRKD